jgi:hypothetical protein
MLLEILPYALYISPLSVQALQSRSCLAYLPYEATAAWSLGRSYSWPPPKSESNLLYNWRFTANQFVLASRPLRLTTRDIFKLILAVIVLVYHPLWREDRFASYKYAWPFLKYIFRMYSILLKKSCFWTAQKSSVSRGFAEQVMPILHILCCNGCLVTWTAVSLTTARFKLLIFYMFGFTLPYTANMFISRFHMTSACFLPSFVK